jgi:hypothetical protein
MVGLQVGGVEEQARSVDRFEEDVAALELGEERQEPLGMLVQDSDRPLHAGPNEQHRIGIPYEEGSAVSVVARKADSAASPAAKLFSASQPPSTVSATPFTYADWSLAR